MKTRRWVTVFDKNGGILWSSLKILSAPELLKGIHKALKGQRIFSWIGMGKAKRAFLP